MARRGATAVDTIEIEEDLGELLTLTLLICHRKGRCAQWSRSMDTHLNPSLPLDWVPLPRIVALLEFGRRRLLHRRKFDLYCDGRSERRRRYRHSALAHMVIEAPSD